MTIQPQDLRRFDTIQIPPHAAVIRRCHRCNSPLLYSLSSRRSGVLCDAGHSWPTFYEFMESYNRHFRKYRALALYFGLTSISWSITAIYRTSLACALVGIAFSLISALCCLRLPSTKE